MAEWTNVPMIHGDATVEFIGATTNPRLSIHDAFGRRCIIYLGSFHTDDATMRTGALAALHTLAAAVQVALLELAPERFARPEGQAFDRVPPRVFAQAHPMAENELRAVHGDR